MWRCGFGLRFTGGVFSPGLIGGGMLSGLDRSSL